MAYNHAERMGAAASSLSKQAAEAPATTSRVETPDAMRVKTPYKGA